MEIASCRTMKIPLLRGRVKLKSMKALLQFRLILIWIVIPIFIVLMTLVVPPFMVEFTITHYRSLSPGDHYLTVKDYAEQVDKNRATFLQMLGGLAFLFGAYWTAQNYQLARKGGNVDRFMKAVDQLGAVDKDGKPIIEVRVGAIYSLDALIRASEEEYWNSIETLCAYVRFRKWDGGVSKVDGAVHPPADLQAALYTLAFRGNQWGDKSRLDLSNADLRGAYFVRSGDDDAGAKLSKCYFWGADLRGAYLSQAEMQDCHLEGADLRDAVLDGANFKGANLQDTDIRALILSDSRNLTVEQLTAAIGDNRTKLPKGITIPPNWLLPDGGKRARRPIWKPDSKSQS